MTVTGYCCVGDCANLATRQGPMGPWCSTHRRRQQPSRQGGKRLLDPVAEKLSLRDQLRSAALALADADSDDDAAFNVLDSKLARVAMRFAQSELDKRLKAERARNVGRPVRISVEQALKAVHMTGSIKKAARALGVSWNTVKAALRRGTHRNEHARMHAVPDAAPTPANVLRMVPRPRTLLLERSAEQRASR